MRELQFGAVATKVGKALMQGAVGPKSNTRPELAHTLFKLGFKDLSQAGFLLDAIWGLVPVDGVVVREFDHTVQLVFSWQREHSEMMRIKKAADSDGALEYLRRKLRTLATAYCLEVVQGEWGSRSVAKLTLRKAYSLVLFQRGHAEVFRKTSNWSVIRQQLAQVPEYHHDAAFKADLNIVTGVLLGNYRRVLDELEVGDFQRYHRAFVDLPTSDYTNIGMGAFAHTYPEHLHERYRFMMIHNTNGLSEVEVLRVDARH